MSAVSFAEDDIAFGALHARTKESSRAVKADNAKLFINDRRCLRRQIGGYDADINRAVIGGIFPVLFNAIIIPFIIVFLCGGVGADQTVETAYFFNFLTIGLSECIGVYGLGLPLYYTLLKLKPLTR